MSRYENRRSSICRCGRRNTRGVSKMRRFSIVVLGATLLSGCGTTMGDRGLSGAGIGAGIGVIGGPPGMLLGGVVGAGVGMISSPRQIDLGRPPWKG